jgi:hypothetical protein
MEEAIEIEGPPGVFGDLDGKTHENISMTFSTVKC